MRVELENVQLESAPGVRVELENVQLESAPGVRVELENVQLESASRCYVYALNNEPFLNIHART